MVIGDWGQNLKNCTQNSMSSLLGLARAARASVEQRRAQGNSSSSSSSSKKKQGSRNQSRKRWITDERGERCVFPMARISVVKILRMIVFHFLHVPWQEVPLVHGRAPIREPSVCCGCTRREGLLLEECGDDAHEKEAETKRARYGKGAGWHQSRETSSAAIED